MQLRTLRLCVGLLAVSLVVARFAIAAPIPAEIGPAQKAAAGSWVVTHNNVASILLGVSFSDTRNGYFAGAINGVGPVIFKTNDGGATISTQVIQGQSATFMDIVASSATSAMTGGLGMWWTFSGAAYTADGSLWKTTENDRWLGSAYQDIQTKGGVYFLPGFWGNATISGNGIAISYDGGKTLTYHEWNPADESARYASFLDRNTGFISGGHWPASSQIMYGDKSGYPFAQKVRLPSPGVGRLAHNPILSAASDYRAVISKTIDGGLTWQVIYDHAGEYYFNTIEFVSQTQGWVVGEGDSEAFILATNDGGRTWTKQYSIARGSLMALDMINQNEGWAAGLDGTGDTNTALFLHTVDGGRTWTKVPTTLKYVITNISAVGSAHVWAVGINLLNNMCSIFQWVPTTNEMAIL